MGSEVLATKRALDLNGCEIYPEDRVRLAGTQMEGAVADVRGDLVLVHWWNGPDDVVGELACKLIVVNQRYRDADLDEVDRS